ncbi:MAG: acetoacetyl-CoA reductase [Proteobacteria bacterium]|nr:acetoacetyl-CoA reductase [Pseudomonadota bacterium]MDA1356476.1 acetoacetyl-CoA reductase [Pseudomonadota bacterium]
MPRLALITGGTRGIGAGIARSLKNAGYRVVVNYHSADAVAESFAAESGIPVFKWDVGDFAACRAGVDEVRSAHGPVDILINNAGTVSDSKFENMDEAQWHRVVRVNLDSVFHMSQQVYSGMMAQKWGRIVNIGSMNGQAGQLNQVNYVAAKAGMHGFTKALALEGAKHGITVNTIAPGYVDTYLMREMPERIMNKIIEKSPIHRLGTEDEIGHAVVFLVDEKSAWTTGSTITLNGGTHMY